MKKLLFLSLFAALFLGFMAPANAAIVNVPVTDDGYRFEHPGGYGWVWGSPYLKSYNDHGGNDAYSPMKFDIAGMLGSYSADDIISAELKLYVTDKQGAGADPYPEGTEGIFNIKVYSMDEPQWSEGADDEDMPEYYMETLEITQSHTTGYPVWESFDFTDIVKTWLAFAPEDANGIEVWDGIPADNLGWYWNAREVTDGTHPYLEVNVVPIPGAVYLLGSGLIGLIGFGRKKIRAQS
jgi:hypothetical protein